MARRRLDQDLHVAEWLLPGRRPMKYARDDGAPAWWRGDEDASGAFLAAMGVDL